MKSFLVTALLVSASAYAYTFDRDVPQEVRDQITNDMAFVKTIQGAKSTPLNAQIFGGVDGTKYVGFFESRVTAVGLDDCGDANAVACVIPFLGSSRIWLTPNYTKFSHPTIAKMMVVFHEARHTERNNGNWGHATCPRPFRNEQGQDMKSIWTGAMLAGQPACDSTPLGSYGSSTIMLKNISKYCDNCTEKVRMDAGIYADDQLGRVLGNAKEQMKQDFAL